MKRIQNFIKKSIIGGLLVVLPAVILFTAFRWVFNGVAQFIQPLTKPLAMHIHAPAVMIDLFVIVLILAACFIVGSITATRSGRWLHNHFDNSLSKLAPGYNLVREIINQLLGSSEDSPFKRGEVARVRLFGSDVATDVTAIVTSRHADGWFSVFVPTGPNPTTGMIYHVPPESVQLLPHIRVDEALRTVIACGAGSGDMFHRVR